MKSILMTAGVCAFALSLRAQSTSFSTIAVFLTSEQPLVTLPQFDAAGIGDELGQAIQLTSVTLSLTGSVSGTLIGTNTAAVSKMVNSLRIEVLTFRATTTNVPGIGFDLVACNAESFFSPDVANPDFLLAPGMFTNFSDHAAPSGDYVDSHLPALSSELRTAYSGVDSVEILLAAAAQSVGGGQDGTRLGMLEALVSMTSTITYTWEVIPEPGVWVGLAGVAGVVLAARCGRRRGGRS